MSNKWYILTRYTRKTAKFLTKNGPTILSVIGSVGVVATAVATGRASVDAANTIDEQKKRRGDDADLTVTDTIRYTCPKFKQAVVLGVATVCCILGANALNRKQQASMLAAYVLLEERYRKYRAKTNELCGAESDNNVRIAVAKDELEPSNRPNVETFYDELSGVMFESTLQDIQNAIYHINRLFVLRGYVEASDYFKAVGIDTDKVPKDILDTGWYEFRAEAIYGYKWIDFYISEQQISDDDTFICNVIHLPVQPYYDEDDDIIGNSCLSNLII